jgi:poly(3-hydroxyalkanoate) synthetase
MSEDMEPREKPRLKYSRQIIDMMSPTNFLPRTPRCSAVDTEGDSLIKGWKTERSGSQQGEMIAAG